MYREKLNHTFTTGKRKRRRSIHPARRPYGWLALAPVIRHLETAPCVCHSPRPVPWATSQRRTGVRFFSTIFRPVRVTFPPKSIRSRMRGPPGSVWDDFRRGHLPSCRIFSGIFTRHENQQHADCVHRSERDRRCQFPDLRRFCFLLDSVTHHSGTPGRAGSFGLTCCEIESAGNMCGF